MEKIGESLVSYVMEYGLRVIGALLLLYIGRIVGRVLKNITVRTLKRAKIESSIIGFTENLVYTGVLIFVGIAILANFGVQTASIIAILGAASFAVGLALQGSLSNFAAGILVLIFHPFRVGHFIEAAGVTGTVKEIQLFSTTMATPENINVTVPNGKLYGDVIKNFSVNPTRRIDSKIGISYDSSVGKALEVLMELSKGDSRILSDPAPLVAVDGFGDSSINLLARFWVNRGDFRQVQFDFNQKIKETFDEQEIEIPFPQRVVHMMKND